MKKRALKTDSDVKNEIEPLIHKLNATFASGKGAVITFISAHEGEGTTTVTRAFANALYESGKRVLLITNEEIASGIVEACASGQDVVSALSGTEEGFSIANWASSPEGMAHSAKLVQDPEFWKSLRNVFDVIVIDAPSLQNANEGVAYSQASNATILVVAAETTRKHVVEHMRDTLTQAGARIAGVVLNKRKFHIPEKVYKRL